MQQAQEPITTRTIALENWLAHVMVEVAPEQSYRIESLAGDASFRCYHRVYVTSLDNNAQETVYIIMDAPPEKESSDDFVSVAQLMSLAVNVPDILAKDMEQGFLMLQDFGTTEFAHLLAHLDQQQDADKQQITAYYQHAIRELITLQTIAIDTAVEAQVPYYDSTLLATEMQLFSDWFIPYVSEGINTEVTLDDNTAWQQLTEQLTREIDKHAKVLVHRDYHSRNIMLDHANPERLGIIDFQDAVIGSYTYDFVSLVRDAYVNWDEATLVEEWHQYFWQALPESITTDKSYDEFYQDVIVMGVQRHLKVLGIFVRLSQRDGKTRYLQDIPKVMDDMMYSLQWLADNGSDDMKTVAVQFIEWLTAEILPCYRNKFSVS